MGRGDAGGFEVTTDIGDYASGVAMRGSHMSTVATMQHFRQNDALTFTKTSDVPRMRLGKVAWSSAEKAIGQRPVCCQQPEVQLRKFI